MLAFLIKSGLSKREISRRTGLSDRTMSSIQAQKKPRKATIQKLRTLLAERQRELAEDAAFRKENGL